MANEQMQAAIKELQDAVVVMAHLEKRQTERLAQTEEEVDQLNAFRLRTEKEILELRKESERFRQRTDENLAEITDKLNGLIGYIESQRPGESLKTLAN
jgi:predicted  nucleic acid-binding Zn-ribbon protein